MLRPAAFLIAIAFIACADDATSPATPDGGEPVDDLKGDSSGLTFHQIDPARPLTSSQRSKVRAALTVLSDLSRKGTSARQRQLAAETLARIQSGDVLIGALASAHGLDLWHMCKDLDHQPACAGPPPSGANAGAWAGDAALVAALVDELDGYMWGNRLYFRFDSSVTATALASTLVHETDHVLNRSECSYYQDYFAHVADPTFAWLEEYRAFVAECVHGRGSNARAARCDSWAAAQLEQREYGFTPDLGLLVGDDARGSLAIAESLFADDGQYGWLAPTAARWPDDFGECETP